MTKLIQINGWSSLSSNKQEQIREWIAQILNAKLAAQNLLEFLRQDNDASDNSMPEFMKALKNTTNSDFEVTDIALEGASDKGNLQALRTNLDARSDLGLNEPRGLSDFCEIVCTTVCGQDGNCYRECRQVCS